MESLLVLTCFVKLAPDGFRTAGRQIECRLCSVGFCGPPPKFFSAFPKGTLQGGIVFFSCDHCRIHPYFHHVTDRIKPRFFSGGKLVRCDLTQRFGKTNRCRSGVCAIDV